MLPRGAPSRCSAAPILPAPRDVFKRFRPLARIGAHTSTPRHAPSRERRFPHHADATLDMSPATVALQLRAPEVSGLHVPEVDSPFTPRPMAGEEARRRGDHPARRGREGGSELSPLYARPIPNCMFLMARLSALRPRRLRPLRQELPIEQPYPSQQQVQDEQRNRPEDRLVPQILVIRDLLPRRIEDRADQRMKAAKMRWK